MQRDTCPSGRHYKTTPRSQGRSEKPDERNIKLLIKDQRARARANENTPDGIKIQRATTIEWASK